jgi:hydroxymethylglutaryl-CoA reductase (NADPH)
MLMKVPGLILKQMYNFGSLENVAGGVRFSVKNRLSDATVTRFAGIKLDGHQVPLANLTLDYAEGEKQHSLKAADISEKKPIAFPLARMIVIQAAGQSLEKGKHEIEISVETTPFGLLTFKVTDAIEEKKERPVAVPYDKEDNYSHKIVRARLRFLEEFAGVKPKHITAASYDPSVTQGNIENFIGVAQVPIGLAGPLKVLGEHAQGEFLIPLATTEGTLVASYNRGIKLLNMSGGVTCTVVDDAMQRAPVFIFDSAREARDFKRWIDQNMAHIAEQAETTSRVAKLLKIETYLAGKFAYLRFNYFTGDAAGQNMVGRATFAACSWILEQVKTVRRFYLESNLATDKKASQVNVMNTRGKRVIAEATIPRDTLAQNMRVDPETLNYHANIANIGTMLSGANNNGAHSPNAITAMFIATGQDVANVSESSAAIGYSEVTKEGDLYISITLPSLIVATHGGGTGLPTQRECLEILGCSGKGKVKKLAEIIAGVVLAGELSLGAAISSLDWVSSHEQYGRNR